MDKFYLYGRWTSTEIYRNCNIANLELPLCCYAWTVGYPYYPMASWFRLFEAVATETKVEKAIQVECSVKGHFLEVLISMYSKNKSAVKIENKITQKFLCHNGVKQGCMLSPTLFNIYLRDLPKNAKHSLNN